MMTERGLNLFLSKIKKTNDCWIWTGGIQGRGYGSFRPYELKKTYLAHRLSWMIKNGEIKDNLCVLHKCDNKICVNPEHLFLGTILDNNRDKTRKGRHHNTKKQACGVCEKKYRKRGDGRRYCMHEGYKA